MLLSLYFPVTRNPSRAVTLPNIGVPHYVGDPHRVTYPYEMAHGTFEFPQYTLLVYKGLSRLGREFQF